MLFGLRIQLALLKPEGAGVAGAYEIDWLAATVEESLGGTHRPAKFRWARGRGQELLLRKDAVSDCPWKRDCEGNLDSISWGKAFGIRGHSRVFGAPWGRQVQRLIGKGFRTGAVARSEGAVRSGGCKVRRQKPSS